MHLAWQSMDYFVPRNDIGDVAFHRLRLSGADTGIRHLVDICARIVGGALQLNTSGLCF